MSTSDAAAAGDRRAGRRRALEAAALVAAFAFLPELLRARDLLPPGPHPGWIAVAVLSARYGSGGFLAGAAAAAAAAGIGSTLAGEGPWAAWSRLASEPDLIALGASLVVSWVAAWHRRRESDLDEKLRSISRRAADSEAAAAALRAVVERLRVRVDRTSASLSFLRDAAMRLEGTDPVASAEAAADLALARAGASIVAIQAGGGASCRRLAVREAGGLGTPAARDLGAADLLVPILAGTDRVGAIALWGVPAAALDPATAHDLSVIASWCARSVAAASEPREAAAIAPEAAAATRREPAAATSREAAAVVPLEAS